MKTFRHFFFLLFSLVTMTVGAQQVAVERRSKTIFAYDEFRVGRVLQPFGRSVVDSVNIFLKDASLCFQRRGKIFSADVTRIIGLQIDSVEYRCFQGMMGRVVERRGYNYLVCVTTINRKKYEEERYGGADLPYFEVMTPTGGGLFLDLDREPRREHEVGIPLKDTYYFLYHGEVVPAIESKFKKYVRPDMKKAFKTLMGDRFWSWKDEKSLRQLLMYLPE